MRIKYLLPIVLVLMVNLISCRDNFSHQINVELEHLSQLCQDSTIFKISNAFPNKWDTLYIFDSMLYPDEISHVIGQPCGCDIVTDGQSLAIFMLNESIIEKELIRMDAYSFVKLREDGVIKIARDAKFRVEKKKVNGIEHYYLFKIN